MNAAVRFLRVERKGSITLESSIIIPLMVWFMIAVTIAQCSFYIYSIIHIQASILAEQALHQPTAHRTIVQESWLSNQSTVPIRFGRSKRVKDATAVRYKPIVLIRMIDLARVNSSLFMQQTRQQPKSEPINQTK